MSDSKETVCSGVARVDGIENVVLSVLNQIWGDVVVI
jgi:hypothetical protein